MTVRCSVVPEARSRSHRWASALAPNVLVIPGVSSVDHLRENVKASEVLLDNEAVQRLSAL
jgi:aryl-alcohol dehydrogenase-like predicted oxidoreductase